MKNPMKSFQLVDCDLTDTPGIGAIIFHPDGRMFAVLPKPEGESPHYVSSNSPAGLVTQISFLFDESNNDLRRELFERVDTKMKTLRSAAAKNN